ncbi:NACHT C-terminal helical domain 2-containing protein [Nostoc sp.]
MIFTLCLLKFWHELLNFNHDSQEAFSDWWRTNGESWALDLKEAMVSHLNLGHEWQFETEDKELIEQYYYIGQLLINGLSNCMMTSKVKSEIEALIFLPIAEIEKRNRETAE